MLYATVYTFCDSWAGEHDVAGRCSGNVHRNGVRRKSGAGSCARRLPDSMHETDDISGSSTWRYARVDEHLVLRGSWIALLVMNRWSSYAWSMTGYGKM